MPRNHPRCAPILARKKTDTSQTGRENGYNLKPSEGGPRKLARRVEREEFAAMRCRDTMLLLMERPPVRIVRWMAFDA